LKNKFLLIGFLLIVSLFVFLNFRVYKSYVQQQTILYEINKGTYDYLEFIDEMEVDFPNISVTSMSMRSVKARYLIRDDKLDEALDLLNTIEYDPLKMSEVQKAEIYYSKADLAKMFNSAREAWKSLPLNQGHLIWYLKSLNNFRDNEEIIEIYNQYKNRVSSPDWLYFYFSAAFNIVDDNYRELIKTQALEILHLFGGEDERLNTVLFYIIFGREEYKESIRLSEKAFEMFSKSDFQNAAENYQKAIDLFSINPDNHYNRMAALFQLNKHSEILETYELLPDSINPKNGKFEFLVGRSYLNFKDTIKACEFFNISKNYNNQPSIRYFDTLCLN
tara:strand:+ start:1400 stop:2401 length:1002 start_codon:yes stop_codon:yes gene_type:complete